MESYIRERIESLVQPGQHDFIVYTTNPNDLDVDKVYKSLVQQYPNICFCLSTSCCIRVFIWIK